MQITASFGGAEVAVEVDADCRTLAAFKATLQAALPSLDVEKMCLEVGGRALDDERVLALEGGSVVELSPTPAARAVKTLREEGCDLDGEGFRRAVESGDVHRCGLYLDAGVDWGHRYSLFTLQSAHPTRTTSKSARSYTMRRLYILPPATATPKRASFSSIVGA